jgi:beta-fructofuranosidase
MEPVGDIASLHTDHQHLDGMPLTANQEILLESIHGDAMEIIAEIDPKDAPMIELNVLRSPAREEFTRVAFFRNRGYRHPDGRYSLITIDSSYASILPDVQSRVPETAPVFLETDEPLKLRVFIDKSVVEVFVNGKQCVAMRVYPGRKDSVGISLRSQGQECRLISLDAWQMSTVY